MANGFLRLRSKGRVESDESWTRRNSCSVIGSPRMMDVRSWRGPRLDIEARDLTKLRHLWRGHDGYCTLTRRGSGTGREPLVRTECAPATRALSEHRWVYLTCTRNRHTLSPTHYHSHHPAYLLPSAGGGRQTRPEQTYQILTCQVTTRDRASRNAPSLTLPPSYRYGPP